MMSLNDTFFGESQINFGRPYTYGDQLIDIWIMNHLLISKIVDLHNSILDFTYESQIFWLMEL